MLQLQHEFRERFRNISRIMDCVSCEKCKVWGKLQILGIGTAIKILLTPTAQLQGWAGGGTKLSRQEIVALINTLNQLAASVEFAAEAAAAELEQRMLEKGQSILTTSAKGAIPAVLIVLIALFWQRRGKGERGTPTPGRNCGSTEGEGGSERGSDNVDADVGEKARRKRDWVAS